MGDQSISRLWAMSLTVFIVYIFFIPMAISRLVASTMPHLEPPNHIYFANQFLFVFMTALVALTVNLLLWKRKPVAIAINIIGMALWIVYWILASYTFITPVW